ncbi:MAG: hypothetical protein KAS32_28670 [Candidatus Peribacteraceae bacterium]|nr:hypothetical protein [Candidatus Peribacteraceae bacterium]
MNVISLKQAKSEGMKKYFTGKPCKHNHISERRVGNRSCIECETIRKAGKKVVPVKVTPVDAVKVIPAQKQKTVRMVKFHMNPRFNTGRSAEIRSDEMVSIKW